MQLPKASRIMGLGHYLPPRVVTNDDLAKMFDTSDEWIQQRSGIKERRYSDPEDTTAVMGAKAARMAVEDAGIEMSDIDFIIFATLSPDHCFPGSSAFVQPLLGLQGVAAMDIRNQCTGFIYAQTVADSFIRAGHATRVLVIGAETHSTGIDFSDRGRAVTVLFGDGAGAAVIGPAEEGQGLIKMELHCDGDGAKHLWVPGPASAHFPTRFNHEMVDNGYCYPQMNGRAVFKEAVTKLGNVIQSVLKDQDMTVDDIDLFVPHQANMRINQMVGRMLSIPDEKTVHNIERYGNTTAATIPIGLSEAKAEGRIKDGDVVMLAAFGSGFTWGAGLMRW